MNKVNKALSSRALMFMSVGRAAKIKGIYRTLPKDISPDLREFIIAGNRIKKSFNISSCHVDKALNDVRKLK